MSRLESGAIERSPSKRKVLASSPIKQDDQQPVRKYGLSNGLSLLDGEINSLQLELSHLYQDLYDMGLLISDPNNHGMADSCNESEAYSPAASKLEGLHLSLERIKDQVSFVRTQLDR